MGLGKRIFINLSFFCLMFFIVSCGAYKQNIMFRVDGETNYDSLGVFVDQINSNYKIDVDDYLEVRVFTSNGEQLIDPEHRSEGSKGTTSSTELSYLVDVNGNVKLPLVGSVNLVGYTFYQADSILSIMYNKYYETTYVKTVAANRRVIVLGANGGQVIKLENENVNLLEIVAESGGITNTSKATNIRLIRGDLKNPAVQVIDLTTIEGMKKASLRVQNKDVIYIEPVRKPVLESIQDVTPIISLLTSVVTFSFLISRTR